MYTNARNTVKKRVMVLAVIFCLIASSIPVFAYDPAPFTDVPKEHWAYASIMNMVRLEVIAGYPDGTFKPDKIVSREEFAKMLCGATSIPLANPRTNTFGDVTKEDWSFRYVETVKDYLTGYPGANGGKPLFLGNQDSTREDVAVALVKIKGFDATNIPNPNILKDMFKDTESVSSRLKDLVSIAVEKKLIQGFEDNTIRGTQSLTRAEAAVLIDRANRIAGDVKDTDLKTKAELLSIKVESNKTSACVGDSFQATAKGFYSNGSTRDITTEVTWNSSDYSVVSVADDGKLVASKAGKAEISASLDGKSSSVKITVTAPSKNECDDIKYIKVTPKTGTLTINQLVALKAEAVKENGQVMDVTNSATWESSNSNIAMVDNHGRVVGLKEGSVQIKVNYKNVIGQSSMTVKKSVVDDVYKPGENVDVKLEAISLSASYQKIRKGTQFGIKATGIYSDSSRKDITNFVTWSADNTGAAQINQDGIIIGLNEGRVKITASFDGETNFMYVDVVR